MDVRLIVVVPFVGLVVACAAPENPAAADGTWVGTITTEGNVTTVVNESGSVWGGTARLVEELSIGVENGPAAYMFGRIGWVHVDDAGIWVADRQTPAVRLFALDGAHLRDFGGVGEGPGEYTRPELIATAPDGRVFVVDGGTRRINVYSATGDILEAMPLGRGAEVGGSSTMAIDAAGTPWLVYRDYDLMDPAARRSPKFVIRAHSGDGPTGEPRPIPEGKVAPSGGGRFRPYWHWSLTPSGDLLGGGSGTYRFEHQPGHGPTTIVEMYGDPVPVSVGEAEYFAHLATLRETTPVAANTIPDIKPAFMALLGASTGETWVLRQGSGFKVPDCDDRPSSVEEAYSGDACWQDALFFDVFGRDGRYLGDVDVPDEMREQIHMWATPPHLAGNHVTAVAMSDAGTIMVKRYRLVLP